ncbi:hypothetical protein JCM10207_006822 [Rhodosporidiobolus poonsookiae]
MRSLVLAPLLAACSLVLAQNKANTFEVLATNVGVSPQQIFAVDHIVYIVDKVENNTQTVAGHPAWAGAYDWTASPPTFTPLDVISNSFCAGGTVLGNGSWVNIGGNAAVNPLGIGIAPDTTNLYGSIDGGKAVRMFTPCTGDGSDGCGQWTDEVGAMPLSRWYPTIETLPTGDAIIIGGELYGSFVNTPEGLQNVPTYEYWPKRGDPVNLYPLTWLLSDGRLFMQAGWQTQLLDYENNVETRLPNITHAQRPYPAGAGSAMLPLVASTNYQETLIFAGGVTPERDDWNQNLWHPVDTQASTSLVAISPLADSPTWEDLDDLPEGRTMGNLIHLPDKRFLLVNGANYGSEGYGWDDWAQAYGQSYAHQPLLRPAYLNTSAPKGSMWDTNLPNSTIPRMYHSVATLLYDGSVWIGGSNPNVDVITEQNNASYPFKTEYRVERFYPSYYDSPRPEPSGLPSSLSYGGQPFNFTLPSSGLSGVDLDSGISVMLIRTGFSTHVMNMGQRAIELQHSYTSSSDSVTIHASQLPPNAALFQPGTATLFIVVNGVPSLGKSVMVGNGQLGTQPTAEAVALPASSGNRAATGSTGQDASGSNGAAGLSVTAVGALAAVMLVAASLVTTLATAAGKARTYEVVGHTGVSAQQLFLGNEDKVYIVDKVQANEIIIDGAKGSHAAWAVEYDIASNTVRALDIVSNSFCAGGNLLGNGSWLNVGGDMSGGQAARILSPCTNGTCGWWDDMYEMPLNRWYPHVETMVDGSAMIIGGELWGGFVNSPDQVQSNPTFEFFPKRDTKKPKNMQFLEDTQPTNLYPLTWLVPNGTTVRKDGLHQQLFMQADWQTTLFHPEKYTEIRLPNITHAQRTYPSGGGNALLPLTPENDYTPTLFFCGGMNPERDDWNQTAWIVIDTAADNSCVSIPFDKKPTWKDEESLPENRSMANMIILPDETLLVLNGAAYGTEGYGWENWHDGKYGQSYARDPVYRPTVYNASAPEGKKWDTDYGESTVARMYHSSATLLPDGSVFVAGSSPSADVITEENNATYPYKTYYDDARPVPSGIPETVSYGGDPFDLTLPTGNVTDPDSVRVSLMRTGFSTHAYNMGMRMVVLNHTYTQNDDGSVVLHVAQVPPHPAIIAPGPAMLFVTVAGVPSHGKFVMIGSGEIEDQTTSAASLLPASIRSEKGSAAAASAAKNAASSSSDKDNSARAILPSLALVTAGGSAAYAAALAL